MDKFIQKHRTGIDYDGNTVIELENIRGKVYLKAKEPDNVELINTLSACLQFIPTKQLTEYLTTFLTTV